MKIDPQDSTQAETGVREAATSLSCGARAGEEVTLDDGRMSQGELPALFRRVAAGRVAARCRTAGVILLLGFPAEAEAGPRLDPGYTALLETYHHGERTDAVLAFRARSNAASLERQFAAIELLVRSSEETQEPPRVGELPLDEALRTAVMLHTEADYAERSSTRGPEQLRQCPGWLAGLAGRYAALLARESKTRDYARRFFAMMAERSRWDACFPDAERWAKNGLELFPADPDLLLSLGSGLEERATLRGDDGAGPAVAKDLEAAEHALALAASGVKGDGIARVHLGRVLWRRRHFAPAKDALLEALAWPRGDREAFLAHLFLGRVYEDVGEVQGARAEYLMASKLEPEAQSSAIALARVLQQSGDNAGSLRALENAIEKAPRGARDPYWDYLYPDEGHLDELIESLIQEALD